MNNFLFIHYLWHRRFVGALGVALPFVLFVFAGKQPSISAYYGTGMRDVFVGVLTAIAVALFVYRGYDREDRVCSLLAGTGLLAVAYAPWNGKYEYVHVAGALMFFLCAAYFCIRLFTRTSGAMTSAKRKRNDVYMLCGTVIVASMLAATFGSAPLFYPESAAVVAFGVSWLVKGEAVLSD